MSELSVKQKNAITLLLMGWRVGVTAREVGVNERTLTRWMEQEPFISELHHQQGRVIDAVSWQLVSLSRSAVQVLGDILESDTLPAGSNIRRLAAVSVLELLLKWKELQDFEERLQALEQQVGNR